MAQLVYTSLEKLIRLLNAASMSQDTCVRVLGPSQLGLGTDPLRLTHVVDLARETISPRSSEESPINLEPSSIQMAEAPASNGSTLAPHRKAPSSEASSGSVGKGKNSLTQRLETA